MTSNQENIQQNSFTPNKHHPIDTESTPKPPKKAFTIPLLSSFKKYTTTKKSKKKKFTPSKPGHFYVPESPKTYIDFKPPKRDKTNLRNDIDERQDKNKQEIKKIVQGRKLTRFGNYQSETGWKPRSTGGGDVDITNCDQIQPINTLVKKQIKKYEGARRFLCNYIVGEEDYDTTVLNRCYNFHEAYKDCLSTHYGHLKTCRKFVKALEQCEAREKVDLELLKKWGIDTKKYEQFCEADDKYDYRFRTRFERNKTR